MRLAGAIYLQLPASNPRFPFLAALASWCYCRFFLRPVNPEPPGAWHFVPQPSFPRCDSILGTSKGPWPSAGRGQPELGKWKKRKLLLLTLQQPSLAERSDSSEVLGPLQGPPIAAEAMIQ